MSMNLLAQLKRALAFDERTDTMEHGKEFLCNARLAPLHELLIECVDAANRFKLVHEKREREDFMKDQQEAWAARAEMFEAIAKLERYLEGRE